MPPRTAGELLLICRPHPRFSDGDILDARNRRQIRHCHAQLLSSVKEAGRNGDGLRPSGTLFEVGQQQSCLYKMERVSRTECRSTNLDTLQQKIVGPDIDADGDFINLGPYIRRHGRGPRHSMFGTTGREYWYSGYRKDGQPNHARLNQWWQEIEARTAHREADFPHWPFSYKERRVFLMLSVDDFTDAEATILTEPLLDESIPGQQIVIELRKRWIQWRDLPDIGDPIDVTNRDVETDVREARDHIRATITREKTR